MARSPLQIGLQIPNFNYPDVAPEQLYGKLGDIATTAEASGFESIWVMDHLNQIPGVGPMENWMLEGNVALMALAARTEKLHVGLMVGGVTYRNPAFLAKQTTTIDVLSGGRAILGIGAAWFEAEHEAFGYRFPPIAERFEHLEDALRIARAMFTEDQPTVEGTHSSVKEIYNNPRPIRGDIPIMVGGSGEKKTLRMVAQYANASNMFGDPERIQHLVGVLQGHCDNLGRNIDEITKTKLASLIIGDDAAKVEAQAAPVRERMGERADGMLLAGTPDQVAEQVQANLDAGLDGIVVNMPYVHDLEQVQLAGQTLAKVING
jgi:F420-dependent oxidoreductase-like protein